MKISSVKVKLFLKILFFIFTLITTVGDVQSSTVVNILQKQNEIQQMSDFFNRNLCKTRRDINN